jgi:protein-disulfide isomerase
MIRLFLGLGGLVAFCLCCTEDQFSVMSCRAGQGDDLQENGIPTRGDGAAPISVTIFGDFQCPPTAKMSRVVLEYVDALETSGHGGKVKMLYRHLPSAYHARARAAALAAAAAYRQGNDAFFALFPHLFKNDEDLEDEDILTYAEQAGLDMEKFEVDLASENVAAAVDRDVAVATEIGFKGTPGVLICGERTDGDAENVVDNLEYLKNKL